MSNVANNQFKYHWHMLKCRSRGMDDVLSRGMDDVLSRGMDIVITC